MQSAFNLFLFVRMASVPFLFYIFWNLNERTKEMQLLTSSFQKTRVYTRIAFLRPRVFLLLLKNESM